MIVIDTSALIAVLRDEPARRAVNEAIEAAESRWMSAATLVEASIVMAARHGAGGVRALDLLLSRADVETIAVDEEQARIARRAYLEFGKGRHAAGLNFGDTFAYALARSTGRPLLCKGDDFARTDVAAVAL